MTLHPAIHAGTVGSAAQQQGLVGCQLRGRGELGRPAFGHPLAPFSFPAELAGLPEHFPLQGCGEVLLLYPVFRVGVGVAVARAIAKGGSIPVGIAQMTGHVLFLCIAHCFEGIKEAQNAVALLCARQVQRGLCQGIQAFGQPHPFEGCGTGFHHNDGLWVGQADVFPCCNQHPPKNEARVLTGFHHSRQPEQRRIGIGAPQRFDEGADGVVVGIAVLVVKHSPLLDGFLGDSQVDLNHAVAIGLGALHR